MPGLRDVFSKSVLHVDFAPTACAQELTLEEYERQLAEKKAQLNKQREAKAVNPNEEFKGMKVGR